MPAVNGLTRPGVVHRDTTSDARPAAWGSVMTGRDDQLAGGSREVAAVVGGLGFIVRASDLCAAVGAACLGSVRSAVPRVGLDISFAELGVAVELAAVEVTAVERGLYLVRGIALRTACTVLTLARRTTPELAVA